MSYEVHGAVVDPHQGHVGLALLLIVRAIAGELVLVLLERAVLGVASESLTGTAPRGVRQFEIRTGSATVCAILTTRTSYTCLYSYTGNVQLQQDQLAPGHESSSHAPRLQMNVIRALRIVVEISSPVSMHVFLERRSHRPPASRSRRDGRDAYLFSSPIIGPLNRIDTRSW